MQIISDPGPGPDPGPGSGSKSYALKLEQKVIDKFLDTSQDCSKTLSAILRFSKDLFL